MCNVSCFEPLNKKQQKLNGMKLQEAINFFESLKTESSETSEIKICEKFLHVLGELKNRGFSKEEIQSIETELENLNLESNPENRKKYFAKALRKFEKYLKDTFSLTSMGHYTNLGIALGSSLGILFGVVFLSSFERSLGISFGISLGLLVGIVVGRYMDSQVKAAGNLI